MRVSRDRTRRVGVLALASTSVVLGVATFFSSEPREPLIATPFFMAAGVLAAISRQGVVISGGDIVLRYPFRNRRVDVSDVIDVVIEPHRGMSGETAIQPLVRLRDGRCFRLPGMQQFDFFGTRASDFPLAAVVADRLRAGPQVSLGEH